MFEELFKQYPGLQNLYENAIANGYQGDPQQLLQEYGQDFSREIGGLGQITDSEAMRSLMSKPQIPATGGLMGQVTEAEMQKMNQMMPQTMVDPTAMAYQRGLLSGSMQPQNPYGYGLATSPYVGYPRNPYGSLLY
jgi:hypothetical protein